MIDVFMHVHELSYLNPGEMPEEGEGEGDGRVHVGAGDVAGGVDHDGDDEATDHRLPQLRDALHVLAVDGRRPARHEHKQERRHHLRYHLPHTSSYTIYILYLLLLLVVVLDLLAS